MKPAQVENTKIQTLSKALHAKPVEWDNSWHPPKPPCVTIATRAKYNQVRVLLFFNYTFVPQSFVSLHNLISIRVNLFEQQPIPSLRRVTLKPL